MWIRPNYAPVRALEIIFCASRPLRGGGQVR